MPNEDGTVWITYNGEFYNFADHLEDLLSKGHKFRSRCDTESIIHLYEEYGIDETLRRMNGMFAFGIWDARNRALILARDRIGKKPLYYAEVDGGLIFASEMKALYASGLINADALDEQAMMEAVRYGTPFGARTVFQQIRMLPPGHLAVWRNGALAVRAYYRNPFETAEPESRPLDTWADELEDLLTDAIRLRFVADVPVGLFLSGGIDSSLVAALTARRLKREVRAYCVSFAEREFDESSHAQAVAAHLGLPITVLPAEQADDELYERIARHTDQPLGDASLIPTFLVSQSARAHRVKVVLTGDGGDEVFAGYELYRTGLKLWGAPAQRARIGQRRTWAERAWEWRTRLRGPARGYLALQQQFGVSHLVRLYRDPRAARRLARRVESDRIALLNLLRNRPVVDRFQYSDMRTMMVDDVLRKVDLMSMANGIECRAPLLDYRVLEFAARLSLDEKIDRAGRAKCLLRHVLARHVPHTLFERPKMGFCMPWATRCAGAYADALIRRWRAARIPHLRADAGDWLFREEGAGASFRTWNAFAQLVFFENYRGWCAAHAAGGTSRE
jgi:asparagine synthase (glutamine-hydrolysing)